MKNNIPLIIERSSKNEIFGRVNYDDDLLVDSASNLKKLESKMRKLLIDFHDLKKDEIQFEIQYDITGLFSNKNFLNASVIADRAGISRELMRQYTTGRKHPSKDRIIIIQKTINSIGEELKSVKVAFPRKEELVEG